METRSISGIKGWLLFFVIFNTLGVIRTVGEIREMLEVGRELPVVMPGAICGIALIILWSAFAIYCLYLICTMDKMAIKFIKLYLIFTPIFRAIMPFAMLFTITSYSSGLSISTSALADFYTPNSIGTILGSAIASAAWYRYFCVSTRVKNTFG